MLKKQLVEKNYKKITAETKAFHSVASFAESNLFSIGRSEKISIEVSELVGGKTPTRGRVKKVRVEFKLIGGY